MKRSRNQVHKQHDTGKYYYHFRTTCQVSRKQLFFKKYLYLENCLRKYFFFQKCFSEITLNPPSPCNPALKPTSSEVFSQSQYAIHSKRKQKQKKKQKQKTKTKDKKQTKQTKN